MSISSLIMYCRRGLPVHSPGWALLPLRAFLGVTFTYAGLTKIFDANYLDDASPLGVHLQMANAAATSPIGPLVSFSADHSTVVGLAIAFGEVCVGIGALLGIFTRAAALGGLLLSLSFFLTVSWTVRPYYFGSDIGFVFAWTPLVLAGDAGVFAVTNRLRALTRRHRYLPAWMARGGEARRTMLLSGVIAAGAAAVGIPAGSIVALTRRTSHPAAAPASTGTTGVATVIAAVDDIPVGSSRTFRTPDGRTAHLLHPAPDTFVAFNAACTHQGCPVAKVDDGFRCPCHGATYDDNGQVTGGPAPAPLVPVPVRVVDGNVTTS